MQMKPDCQKIYQLAKPYLSARHNDVHTEISMQFAYGPNSNSPQLNRLHEVEGIKIAGDILRQINYPEEKISEIIEIINGHDSRQEALSLNDRIVKDADKLWRYSKEGFKIDIERFEESYAQGLNRLRRNLSGWFFTETGKKLANAELLVRERETEI